MCVTNQPFVGYKNTEAQRNFISFRLADKNSVPLCPKPKEVA